MQGALPWAIVGAQSTEAAVAVRLGVGCQLQVMEVQHVFSAECNEQTMTWASIMGNDDVSPCIQSRVDMSGKPLILTTSMMIMRWLNKMHVSYNY